jgi:hypothetical protein
MSANALHEAATRVAHPDEWHTFSSLAALLTKSGVTKCDGETVKGLILNSAALKQSLELQNNDTGAYLKRKGQERFLQLREPANDGHNWTNAPETPSSKPAQILSADLRVRAQATVAKWHDVREKKKQQKKKKKREALEAPTPRLANPLLPRELTLPSWALSKDR